MCEGLSGRRDQLKAVGNQKEEQSRESKHTANQLACCKVELVDCSLSGRCKCQTPLITVFGESWQTRLAVIRRGRLNLGYVLIVAVRGGFAREKKNVVHGIKAAIVEVMVASLPWINSSKGWQRAERRMVLHFSLMVHRRGEVSNSFLSAT